jgi:type I restriction enzyme M protein
MATNRQKNKYCSFANLKNESDVEQFLIVPLLAELGYTSDYLETKATIRQAMIGKGKKRRAYVPDYLAYLTPRKDKPVLIIDAKHPNQSAHEGVEDAQLYASVIRRRMSAPKPDQYCMGINGHELIVKHYDSDSILFQLAFPDLVDGNLTWRAFCKAMNREAVAHAAAQTESPFEFRKPEVGEIRALFEVCHDVIWKREFESPVPAFWEFCKLMFIKLHADRLIHADQELQALLSSGQPLPADRVPFSTHYIDRSTSPSNPNPIATNFETVRNELEAQILTGEKKRIFDTDEHLNLEPLTIRRVVGLLQHHDLIRIDEDLNGRLFQTFLSATMRGKQLGQFFTPRTVVDFMCDLAELTITNKPPYGPLVLDACCGTGGFLIEAMAKMTGQLKHGRLAKLLSEREKKKIEKAIKDERLFGIDAGKDPPVARIARINMYLHGDGGSRIFSADALDKRVGILPTTSPELKRELGQLRTLITGDARLRFDVVLTNPPFSMKKEAREADQRDILEEYEAAYKYNSKGIRRLRPSLKSNVMFLERYRDLLRVGGRLITVIDESVLNTTSDADHRERLFRHFYVRAIISLPQNAFSEAGANVKTSILVLDLKDGPSGDQPSTFYGRSANIGYKGSRINENLSDLPEVLKAALEFQRSGKIAETPKSHWTDRTRFFAAKLAEPRGRMDSEWHDPRHEEMEKRLQSIAKEKGYIVQTLGGQSGLCELIRGKSAEEYVSQGVPIVKVRNVTGEGIDWDTDFVLKLSYDNSPRSHLHKGDVLVTTTGLGTIGRIDLLETGQPCLTDAHVTNLRLRSPRKISPDFLVHYLRSPLGQMQMERYTVGCTGQTELNDSDLARVKVIYPADPGDQETVLSEAKRYEEAAKAAREEHQRNRSLSRTEFERLLGL